MSDILITYWIRGQGSEKISDIKISTTAKVDTLKQKIKESRSNLLKDVDVEDMELYQLKDPVALDQLKTVTLSESAQRLNSRWNISQVFTEQPPEDRIHIIVDDPHARLIIYYIRGATFLETSSIRISGSTTLVELRTKIAEKHERLSSIPENCIAFHRPLARTLDELEESLDAVPADKRLNINLCVSNVLLDAPVLDSNHLIVQVSEAKAPRIPPSSARSVTTAAGLKADRAKFISDFFPEGKRSLSPSNSSHPSSFRTQQENNLTHIPCGRPRDPRYEELIPATLLHEAFGEFIDVSKTYEVTADDNDKIKILATAMSRNYKTEMDRVKEFVEIVKQEYGLTELHIGKLDGLATDVCLSWIERYEQLLRYLIAEFKNEWGAGSSEPYMQAIAYYVRATKDTACKLTGSPLPCLLFVLTGSCMFFAGAAWTTRPCVQMLSTPVVFNYHSTDKDTRIHAARHMAAFRKAIHSLKNYYESFPGSRSALEANVAMQYPYRRHFMSLDGRKIDLTYTGRLDVEPKRLVFFGTIQENSKETQVFIKFVDNYSRDAHMHFASKEVAPKLFGCEPLPGGWYIVVMEMLDGYESLADIHAKQGKLPKSVFDDMKEHLDALHQLNLVHGDFRDTNILVKKDDKTKYMIVDFDWAGEIGKVKYPAYVNYSDVARPDDARDEMPVLAEHDVWMFHWMQSRMAESEPGSP